jgi:hypothetical protein
VNLKSSEDTMRTLTLRIPEFGFIVATRAALAFGAGLLASTRIPERAALAFGAGLLASTRIPERRRRALGLALVSIGAAATVPAVMTIRRNVGPAR